MLRYQEKKPYLPSVVTPSTLATAAQNSSSSSTTANEPHNDVLHMSMHHSQLPTQVLPTVVTSVAAAAAEVGISLADAKK